MGAFIASFLFVLLAEMGDKTQLLAIDCALNELYGLGYLYPFQAKERFEAVTLEGVKKAAVSVFSTDKMAVSIIVPQTKK